jgi:hypothetical protein
VSFQFFFDDEFFNIEFGREHVAFFGTMSRVSATKGCFRIHECSVMLLSDLVVPKNSMPMLLY